MILSLLQKAEICAKLDKGISGNYLANEYNVAKSTISRIKKHRNDIKNAISDGYNGGFKLYRHPQTISNPLHGYDGETCRKQSKQTEDFSTDSNRQPTVSLKEENESCSDYSTSTEGLEDKTNENMSVNADKTVLENDSMSESSGCEDNSKMDNSVDFRISFQKHGNSNQLMSSAEDMDQSSEGSEMNDESNQGDDDEIIERNSYAAQDQEHDSSNNIGFEKDFHSDGSEMCSTSDGSELDVDEASSYASRDSTGSYSDMESEESETIIDPYSPFEDDDVRFVNDPNKLCDRLRILLNANHEIKKVISKLRIMGFIR